MSSSSCPGKENESTEGLPCSALGSPTTPGAQLSKIHGSATPPACPSSANPHLLSLTSTPALLLAPTQLQVTTQTPWAEQIPSQRLCLQPPAPQTRGGSKASNTKPTSMGFGSSFLRREAPAEISSITSQAKRDQTEAPASKPHSPSTRRVLSPPGSFLCNPAVGFLSLIRLVGNPARPAALV